MGATTKIQWTEATWNPIRGCTRVSPGCVNCYAEIMAARFSDPGQWGHGFAQIVSKPDGSIDHRWTGKMALIEDKLFEPLRWKRPRRIFVNSTSDLFHEDLPDEVIDKIFAVMALAPQHTFQILTKRADRMRAHCANGYDAWPGRIFPHWAKIGVEFFGAKKMAEITTPFQLPLPNVWLGVSVEDQPRADERIPQLLATPAAVRFLSCEPLLEPIDLTEIASDGDRYTDALRPLSAAEQEAAWGDPDEHYEDIPALDWVIVGGESGPGARPFNIDWARSIVRQGKDAGVPIFVKQMGANPVGGPRGDRLELRDGHGADMEEWPRDLRVREFPNIGATP